MKSTLLFLSMILFGQSNAADKDDTSTIAKSIQCTYLREKSYSNISEQYSVEKSNQEYINKVSDSIYAQAFKICDPDNSVNADKEILTVCTTGCDQYVIKGLLGVGGSSTSDVQKCKKMCQNYSDLLGLNYVAATKAIKKYIGTIPPVVSTPAEPAVPAAAALEKEIEKKD